MPDHKVVDYEVVFLLSGWCVGYADSIRSGVKAALTQGGYPEDRIEFVRIREIHPETGLAGWWSVDSQITALSALYFALPAAFQKPQVLDPLARLYHQEVARLSESVQDPRCVRGAIRLHPWRRAGSQWICEFESHDKGAPEGRETNLHGQDTSQWKNAKTGWIGHQGAVVFDETNGKVSSHH